MITEKIKLKLDEEIFKKLLQDAMKKLELKFTGEESTDDILVFRQSAQIWINNGLKVYGRQESTLLKL